MNLRSLIESYYAKQTQVFEQSQGFQYLVSGVADIKFYDEFIANLCKTHLKSPQILAFLYAAAPPSVANQIQHNMLEELGLDSEGICHPDLLRKLADAVGSDNAKQAQIEALSQAELYRMCSEPMLYGTLKELALSVLLEVTCFEWMLSRLSGKLGKALQEYRGLDQDSLEWFFHHSEVDIRHAEEGLDSVINYIEYYNFEHEDLETILDVTFRENIFIKRYFGEIALAKATEMLA
ncbi:MAG: iron-containing redox enzyme family protein [Calothrix sp. C42_A2020_038]|nr:iron-containing redox enzyme family protein [Calothrix sp. C42_A2020_038]